MQDALSLKCQKTNEYIKFISHFGPALTGTTFWNNNKTTKLQEQKKSGETDVQVPVSNTHLGL
jgi:hypothetical protein